MFIIIGLLYTETHSPIENVFFINVQMATVMTEA